LLIGDEINSDDDLLNSDFVLSNDIIGSSFGKE
jgi:hypothetical protein